VSADGYASWEKNVAVTPGRATEYRNIRLFPTKPSHTTLASAVATFSLAPSRQLLAVTSAENEISVLDIEGVEVASPVLLPETPNGLLWSPDSTSVLILMPVEPPHLLSVSTGRLSALINLAGAHDFAWDPRVASRLLFVGPADGLRALNVATGSSTLLTEDVAEFATSSRNIFTVSPTNTVRVHNMQGALLNSAPVFEKPVAGLYVTPGGSVAARSVDGALSVVGLDGHATEIVSEFESVGWSPNGRMLYVQSDSNSLQIYNVRDERWLLSHEQLQLVQRLSRPIRNVNWFAGGRHLLYQVNDEILITEIDTRDHAITYQVDSVNLGDAQAAVGEDGEQLFYLKHQSGTQELIVADLLVAS